MKERIRAIRGKKTQSEFAKSLNVSLSSVQAWEYGLGKPSFAMRKLICATYGINQIWLETGEGEMYEKSASQTLDAIATRYNASPTFRAMLDVYSKLTRTEQDAIERYFFLLAETISANQRPEQMKSDSITQNTIISDTHEREAHHQGAEASR